MGSKKAPGRPRVRRQAPGKTPLAEAIYRARLALGLQQKDLAELVGVNVSRVRAWESATVEGRNEPREQLAVHDNHPTDGQLPRPRVRGGKPAGPIVSESPDRIERLFGCQ